MNCQKNKNIITLFGCGGDRDKSKRKIMAEIAEKYSNHVYITSDNPRSEDLSVIIKQICKGFKGSNYTIIRDRAHAIKIAMQNLDNDSILLVLGKGRDSYEEINGTRYPHNDFEIINKFSDAY